MLRYSCLVQLYDVIIFSSLREKYFKSERSEWVKYLFEAICCVFSCFFNRLLRQINLCIFTLRCTMQNLFSSQWLVFISQWRGFFFIIARKIFQNERSEWMKYLFEAICWLLRKLKHITSSNKSLPFSASLQKTKFIFLAMTGIV